MQQLDGTSETNGSHAFPCGLRSWITNNELFSSN
jgi:hypothetical protein